MNKQGPLDHKDNMYHELRIRGIPTQSCMVQPAAILSGEQKTIKSHNSVPIEGN